MAPIQRKGLGEAADLLFSAYAGEPEFGQLCGLPREQLDVFRPIFPQLLAWLSGIPGVTLGCYRSGKLVGVISYYPDQRVPLYRVFAQRPIAATVALLRHAYARCSWRPRLPAHALARWRAFLSLAREQSPKEPTMHVAALGVVQSARQSGIAKRLLAAIEADNRWQKIGHIQVETWHQGNVAIYERLGFETVRRESRKGVECWTLLRARRTGPC